MASPAANITIRISATGNRIPREFCYGGRLAGQKGFTLIELMVVLAVMGVVLSVSVFMLTGHHQHALLRQEAHRLRETLSMVAEDAVLSGRDWGVTITPEGCRFAYFNEQTGRWTDDRQLTQYLLPPSLHIKANIATPLLLPADNGGPGVPHPDLLLLSSGATSAFTLELAAGSDIARVSADGSSDIVAGDTP